MGQGFDVRVAIAGRQAIGRIVVELSYDASRLKARTLDEIDYAGRAELDRAFSINPLDEGHVELVLDKKRSEVGSGLPASVRLVQFEALAPGRTEIRVASISVSDPTDRSLQWAAAGQERTIIVN